MFHYYNLQNKILFSIKEYPSLNRITEIEAKNHDNNIYFLNSLNPATSRKSFSISDSSLFFLEKENLSLLQKKDFNNKSIPEWILDKINSRNVVSINTQYPNWIESLNYNFPKKWKLTLLALGDVGGTLLTGLRLIGGDYISEIGIYDREETNVKRWEYEANQITSPFNKYSHPEVYGTTKDELFDCNMFIFCASRSVPPVGSNTTDVRMAQFQSNSEIISEYAKIAREKNFKGIFAVVSDPVDLLCKVAFLESNKSHSGEFDFAGLGAEQIRGYGLGVMNARAIYYAKKNTETIHYLEEGRAFGPHGDGLVIADSIQNYNEEISTNLTNKTKTANLEVRKTGFKPYIAPALSSGALSILATIQGDWHYSATYMGGVFMGAKNKLTQSGTELERLDLPISLFDELKNTYEKLENII